MALDLKTVGKTVGPISKDYDWKDLALYAIGVGAGFDDLDYCYEQRLKVIPSWGIASIFEFLAEVALASKANLGGILHGEHELIVHRTIPQEGTITTSGRVTHIYDKGEGKGAIVVAEADTIHSSGEKLFTNVFTLFCRLDGGFGGENVPAEAFEIPDRDPDFVEEARPTPDQPLVYRLSGDIFALHVDPDFARASGFEKPIMHGLCTLGYATRALIKHLFPGEPGRLSRLKVRFTKPLYPGTPIKTLVWKDGEGRAIYRTVNAETGDVAIDRGVVEWVSSEEAAARDARVGVRFDDRVAIVTGAGGGLGRTYALELAARGAKVVVNDLGGGTDGSGGSDGPADAVVKEIKEAGGEAVASYDSVSTAEGGKAIVDTALEAFGRVDILINNAGILRDRSLLKLNPEDWQSVLDVHLTGAYNVTRPALAQMKEQGYGRIVLTSSAAGLYGNFGQTNYGAAKLGLVGFMNTLKIEGKKAGITANTVAPVAASRLTEGIFPPNVLDKVQPEAVSPLVLYLCSERCTASGGVYNAGAGYFSRAAVLTGTGVTFEKPEELTPEAIADRWSEVSSLDGAVEHDDAMTAIMGMLVPPKKEPAGEKKAGGSPLAGKVKAVFDKMPGAFKKDAAEGVDVVFQWNVEGGGQYSVTVKDGACEIKKESHPSPTTTLAIGAEDFLAMMSGSLPAMQAYTSGKLQISGDLMKSQLIEKLFKI